jgi:hypothetical protein
MADLNIHIRISSRLFQCSAVALLLFAAAGKLSSESVTLTTYYPAPSGVYTQMVTTGNTYLARDGGTVAIGTTAPGAKLSVTGPAGAAFQIEDGTQGTNKVLISDANGMASWQKQFAFGGMYTIDSRSKSQCYAGNALNGNQCSCPAGYSAHLFLDFDNSGTAFYSSYFCSKP